MLYRAHLQLFLVLLLAAGAVCAQTADTGPVTKGDVLAALEAAKESADLLKKANEDLLVAIAQRGVDFVLTPEEEWQFGMRDASDELLKAIRDAVDPKEREARISADRQQRLYNEFAANYNSSDLTGRRAALNAGREFVLLYADDGNVAEIVTFMRRNLPRLEQSVNMMEQREAAMERARTEALARQQRMQQEREQRDRRREESAEAAAAREQSRRRDANSANRSDKEEAPPPRQPSDPVYRPRTPVVRRP